MDAPEFAPAMTTGSSALTKPRFLLPAAILAGVFAGVLACLAGEAVLQANQSSLGTIRKARPTPADVYKQVLVIVDCATVTYATLGGLLGMALGLAGGLAQRSARGVTIGAVSGLALGGGVGGLVTRFLLPIYYQNKDPDAMDLVLPLLTHGAIWSALGATGGLVFGLRLGPRRWKGTMIGGFVGAALASVVYEIVGAIAFSVARTDLPLSATATTRGMALLLVASLAATGAALAVPKTPIAPTRSDRPG